MADLPISNKEYDYVVLMTDFISKLKKINLDNGNEYEFNFTPILKGYEITYNDSENEYRIVIKRNIFNGLNIKKYSNGKFKRFYSSRTPQDNEYIINKIFE